MEIRKAGVKDAKRLTNLTMTSKAFWNYSKTQLENWKSVLTISEQYLIENTAYVLSLNEEIVGYYSLLIQSSIVELDNLFVHPKFIRKGFGKILLNHCIESAKELNASSILVYSDPNAEAFYTKHGFETIRQEKTSEINRFLPVMTLLF